MTTLLHFNDLHKQSVRLDSIIHVIKDESCSRDYTALKGPSKMYYEIKLTVDLHVEHDFTGNEKREISLWYSEDKSARDADLQMIRMASSTFIQQNPKSAI